jgi:hypothetical protein
VRLLEPWRRTPPSNFGASIGSGAPLSWNSPFRIARSDSADSPSVISSTLSRAPRAVGPEDLSSELRSATNMLEIVRGRLRLFMLASRRGPNAARRTPPGNRDSSATIALARGNDQSAGGAEATFKDAHLTMASIAVMAAEPAIFSIGLGGVECRFATAIECLRLTTSAFQVGPLGAASKVSIFWWAWR